ncbi:hypothetical protein [Streptomyces sp. NPDC102282]|uniref:hypothetical protein n=1 Tax=Streptomyces sp. NPDC102282 TaxID=3366154 RepID=UPI003806AE8A
MNQHISTAVEALAGGASRDRSRAKRSGRNSASHRDRLHRVAGTRDPVGRAPVTRDAATHDV